MRNHYQWLVSDNVNSIGIIGRARAALFRAAYRSGAGYPMRDFSAAAISALVSPLGKRWP